MKLYWIDYTTTGLPLVGGPMIGPWAFENVGFEVKFKFWYPPDISEDSLAYLNDIFLDMENWNPQIIIFMFNGNWASQDETDEPTELIQLCERIRKSPKLEAVKIMTFLRTKDFSLEKQNEWKKRCDFYSPLPLKIIKHAKIAKQLAGKQPDDTEGATYYLSTHDSWEIFENSTFEQKQSDMLLKASGKFINTPRIRLLGITTNKYRWIKDGIKPNTPTKISYLTKDLSKWQYGLSEKEMQRLNDLKNSSSLDCQLLLGVNSDFLDIEEPTMIRSIKQANDNGWQIFIIEHMWLANHWLVTYDNLLYEKDFIEKRTLDMMRFICP